MSGDEESVPDLGALLARLGEVQQNLEQAQESAAATVLEGSAGGGAVKVRATGALEFIEVEIAPEVVDPSDVEMLQDLVLAAIRDVSEQAHAEAAQALGGLSGLGGFGGLGGLGGDPGGLDAEDYDGQEEPLDPDDLHGGGNQ